MNYFGRLWEVEMMKKNDTYHSLKEICVALTNKHLPKDVFFAIWCNMDHIDWEIQSDCYKDFITVNYDFCYKERGSFKYKKNKKPVMRLKKLYVDFHLQDDD